MIKKTCMNCWHFHGCLSEEEPSYYHIHDYCDKLNMVLNKNMESEVNAFLDDHWQDKEDACKKVGIEDTCVNDDFETGEAYCWMFAEAITPTTIDLEANRKANRDLAIVTLEHILETGKTYDKWDQGYTSITDKYDEEDITWLKNLLNRLKEEKANGN